MSKHQFIVAYDSDTKQWLWDTEAEMTILPNSVTLGEGETDESIRRLDVIVVKALTCILDLTNGLVQKDLTINLLDEQAGEDNA